MSASDAGREYLSRLLARTHGGRFYSRVLAPTGVYKYVIARTKYIDAVFKEALAEKFDQILLFGAGFDTRALRFQTEAQHTRIFELDAPFTQQAKLQQYKNAT